MASDVERGDGATGISRAERRQARERERQRVTAAAAAAVAALMPHGSPAAAATASRFPATAAAANTSHVGLFSIDCRICSDSSFLQASASHSTDVRTAQEEASETMLRFAEAARAVVSDLNNSQRQSTQPGAASSSSAAASATPRTAPGATSGSGTAGQLPVELETMSHLTDRMDLSQFNAEQQATILDFLQAVGMASLEEHASGVTVALQHIQTESQLAQAQPHSHTHSHSHSHCHSRSHSQPQNSNSNPSGSSSTTTSDSPARRDRERGDVSIEISERHAIAMQAAMEIALQDSMVAMEVAFAEEREGDEDMWMVIG